ncbi:hypothetical protein [Paenibacillus humicola]|uniref:hypothetical protein n=1 Tax=Paenibacillus humicola TaxID=3110540 RepID=UPI00237BE632|nr:hypothetical protein [Paenibacillus humicola]
MRVPQFERYARLSQGTALLIVGALIGALVYHSIFFMNFNALRTTNLELEERLIQSENDLEKLNQFKNQHTIIKSILPIMEESRTGGGRNAGMNELTKSILRATIRKELGVLIGRSIYDIDSDAKLARLLLARKEYTVQDKEYAVEIKTMLVADNVLRVWFTAKEKEPPPG